MNQQAFRRNYSDLRRLLNQNLRAAGHFTAQPVVLPGRLNNSWTALFNVKGKRVIALYRVKNGLCILMIRSKSPYHQLIADNLRAREGVEAVAWRKIPVSAGVTRLNQLIRGMRVEGKTARKTLNEERGWKRDGRTATRDPERS